MGDQVLTVPAHAPQQFKKAPALSLPAEVVISTEAAVGIDSKHLHFLFEDDPSGGRGGGERPAKIARIQTCFLQPQKRPPPGERPGTRLAASWASMLRRVGLGFRQNPAFGRVAWRVLRVRSGTECRDKRSTRLKYSG